MNSEVQKRPVRLAIMTISDSRTLENDTSGDALVEMATGDGHEVVERILVPDDIYRIRYEISRWIIDPGVEAVITTGGTGLTGRDGTPEAVAPLLDRTIEGFGELFRYVSYKTVRTSTIASRAIGGVANGTFIFCLPGSTGACKDAWKGVLSDQFDIRHRPCNLVELMPRLTES
jgi:molybdenum cofactor biosynthesis protein B